MVSYKNILVCVTQQKTCERLIKKAAEYKSGDTTDLFVIHVAKNAWNFLDSVREGEALDYLFGISKSVGANLTVLKSDDIVDTIAEFARENKIDFIIMGEPTGDHFENNFYLALTHMLKNVEIMVVPQN